MWAAFAITQGLSESVLGILMGVSAFFGILGTFMYPIMVMRVGLVRTGIMALSAEVSCLSLCVMSVWLDGSPFDPHFYTNSENQLASDGCNFCPSTITATLTDTAFVTSQDKSSNFISSISEGQTANITLHVPGKYVANIVRSKMINVSSESLSFVRISTGSMSAALSVTNTTDSSVKASVAVSSNAKLLLSKTVYSYDSNLQLTSISASNSSSEIVSQIASRADVEESSVDISTTSLPLLGMTKQGNNGQHSFLSIGVLIAGIVLARFGESLIL